MTKSIKFGSFLDSLNAQLKGLKLALLACGLYYKYIMIKNDNRKHSSLVMPVL